MTGRDPNDKAPLIAAIVVAVLAFAAFLFIVHEGRALLPQISVAHAHLKIQTLHHPGASAPI